mgnify:CR=1 FL=1
MKKFYRMKWLIIFLLVILAISFLLISGNAEEKIILKLGHHHNVGGQVDKLCYKFKELAEEKSNGHLQINIFPGGQLGQEKEAIEGILMGTLQLTVVTSSFFANIADGFGLDALPFMYNSFEQVTKVFTDSEAGKELEKNLIEKGGRILGWFIFGSRNMLFIDKEIKTLEEIKGLKMRSPENDIWIGMFRSLGCRPTPITWGECYTALQTGVVDGMESPIAMTIDMKFHEVAKYCLLTHHMWGAMNLIINEALFEKLPKDIQDVIICAGKEAVNYANQLAIKEQEEAIVWLKNYGMKFIELPPEEWNKFKESVVPMVDKWAQNNNATHLVGIIREITK